MQAKWLLTICLAAGALGATGFLPAADKEKTPAFESGLKPGDRLFSFKCHGVTGPHKGKTLCFI